MTKKAYLVTFSVRTRVVSTDPDEAVTQAIEKILSDAENYIIGENLDKIEPDDECPYRNCVDGTFKGER
jgi:hypothetical protein